MRRAVKTSGATASSGAGASKTSGIPTGEELAKQWHGEILEQCSKEEIKELKKRLGVRSTKPSSRAYFDLYAMRFFPDYQNGSAFLERTLERAQPSLGYYPLAALLANTRNNLVITTNFDSLVEDALFIYTDKRPIVISHELLAQYINFNTSRPIIAKLHRGLFFDPLNRAEQVNGLSKQWKDILREAFKRYTPVVIGYAGGDHSLMDFLKETECLSGLYWCYRHDEPPEEIQKVVERHSGYFIPIEGFDEMMYLMGQRFGYTDPCEHIESAAEQRVRDYQEQVKAFQEKLRAAETPSETQSAILRAMDAKQREELQRLDRRIELDEEDGEAYWERGKLYYFANDYAQALEDFTKAKELGMEDSKLYWYKGFCYRRLGETELAIREYSRSLELKETSEVYRNRGLCFTTVKLYDKAVLDFTRAIKLPPGDKRLYRERGSAYQALEEYKKAQADYEKALELEPADAELYTTLGDVQERLGEVQEALQSYQKAIQIDPNYARAYNNRGVVYLSQMETEKALADHRKAVKLAGDRALYHVNVGIVLNRLNMDIEIKAGIQDVCSQKAALSGLVDGHGQTFHGQWVFRPDINISLMSLGGDAGDDHALQDPMRIALHHGAVHERARIALISVADYVFLGTGLTQNLLPLSAGGEAAASASTETGLRDLLYDPFRRHVEQGLCHGAVTAHGDVFPDGFGVDVAAVL